MSKRESRFSDFVTFSLVILEIVSLSLVGGILYGILSYTLTNDFYHKVEIEKNVVSSNVHERLSTIENELKDISYNNVVRVNLVLENAYQIKEFIDERYPYENGLFFIVQPHASSAFLGTVPAEYENYVDVLHEHLRPYNGFHITKFHKDKTEHYLTYMSLPITKDKTRLGTVYAVYDIARDAQFWNRYDGNTAMDIFVINDERKFINLENGEKLDLASARVESKNNIIFLKGNRWLEKLCFVPLRELTGLYYAKGTEPLTTEKMQLVQLICVLSVFIFVLTIFVAFLIRRKINSFLIDMVRQAFAIAKDPEVTKLDENVEYVEFRGFAKAFNKVLEKLLTVQNDLKKRSDEIILLNESLEVRVNERTQELETINGLLEKEIHDRRMIDDVVRKSKDTLQTILDSMPFGVMVVDKDKVVRQINNAALQLCGYTTADEVSGKICNSIVCPAAVGKCPIQDEGQVLDRSERKLMHKDGHAVPILKSAIPIVIDGEEVYLEAFIDITERKEAVEALSLRLRYEEALAACSHELIENYDDSITNAFQHLCQAAGVSRVYMCENLYDETGGLYAQQNFEVCAPGVKSRLDNPDLQHLSYGRDGFEYWAEELKHGRIVRGIVDDMTEGEQRVFQPLGVLSVIIIPLFIKGAWAGFIGFDDIRNRREWGSDELHVLRAAVGMVASFMAREQADAALKDAMRQAEEMSLLKTRFLSNVSHEIRTPLNCIIGFSETILHANPTQNIRKQTETILHESESLLLLINDLLDHAKIESGKFDLEFRPIKLKQFAEHISRSISVQLNDSNVSFEILIDDSVPQYVWIDPLRLRQVLVNLLSNAIKFTERGTITLRVSLLQEESTCSQIRFSVSDTGIGIAQEKQSTIFELFQQADGSTTRKYGGTGLGVTISRELVRKMGGELRLESEVGVGSTFWFDIALKTCTEKEVESVKQLEKDEFNDDIENAEADVSILVVEDYSANQEVARVQLESAGYSVTIAEDGEEAVTFCNKRFFDVIFMDVQMPRMDGHAATKAIRERSDFCAHVPIIAMTANADEASRKQCMDSGMDDVITKPIRRKVFLSATYKWVKISRNQHTHEAVDVSVDLQSAEFDDIFSYHDGLKECEGNQTEFEFLVKQFLADAHECANGIEIALKAKDYDAIRTEAQKIQFGAAKITAMKFAKVAQMMAKLASLKRGYDMHSWLHTFKGSLRELHSVALEQLDSGK